MDTTFKYKDYEFIDNDRFKIIHSKDFNYFFNKENGDSERWGRTKEECDDPIHCDLGPIVMDLELCKDINNDNLEKYKNEILLENKQCIGKCPWCFKDNGIYKYTHVMTFIKFKEALMKMCNTHIKINEKLYYHLEKIPYNGKMIRAMDYPNINWETDICNCSPLSQVALVNTNLTTNTELLRICEFARKMGVVPDVTCHGKDDLSDDFLSRLCYLCGNVAVSKYDKEKTYNLVQRLHYLGSRQTDIDIFLSEETYENAMNTCIDYLNDGRLKYIHSLTFLMLKQHGRGKKFHQISEEHYRKLYDFIFDNKIVFAIDPCQYFRLKDYLIKYRQNELKDFDTVYDKCDGNRSSCYVNTLGEFYPCAFMEDEPQWKNPPNVFDCYNFIDEIWNGPRSQMYNVELMTNGFSCPMFNNFFNEE